MAHEIVGARFFNRSNKPAWHGIGINDEAATLTAAEAAERLGGIYSVEKRPMTALVNGVVEETGFYSLVRSPIKEDPCERIIGNPVKADYELITPQDAVDLYDQNVRDEQGRIAPVETMGFLGQGERLFITTKLPKTFNINGDEVVTYLLYDNPMKSGFSAGVYVTGIRTVCQNTLHAGISAAVERRQVLHMGGAKAALATWLNGIYIRALAASEQLAEGYTALANKRISDDQVKWIIAESYPMPKKPSFQDVHTKDMEDREKRYEWMADITNRQREFAFRLYNGEGVGMDSDAVKGTAFGAYNAVAELETFRRGRGKTDSATRELIAGERAQRIRNAFALAQNVDHWQTANAVSLKIRTKEYA